MPAPSKRARKIRSKDEFELARLLSALVTPPVSPQAYSWTLEDIVAARDEQMRGRFRLPSRLVDSMRTDDAIVVAKENRLDPIKCTKAELVAAKKPRGKTVAEEAAALYGEGGIGFTKDTERDVHSCLVEHGLAFGQNLQQLRPDGSRIDCRVQYWPIEFVRWDSSARAFKTRVASGFEETIVHGDGRWIIWQTGEVDPFKNGCLIAACMVWSRHAFGIRDWSQGSVSHGLAKMIAQLPQGVRLQNAQGMTPEAEAMLRLLGDLMSGAAPFGVIPAGSKVEYAANASTNYQIFSELVGNGEKAAARIYLGTDGILGANGGAPGIDITALFGVARTKVEGDAKTINRGLQEGSIDIWTALNFGDSTLAPKRRYLLPDADTDAERDSYAKREADFYSTIDNAKRNGFVVDQEFVDDVARKKGIAPPRLPVEATKAPSIALAPTDIARVVSVNEARASAGVPPLTRPDGSPDPDGQLTVEEYAAKKAARAASTLPA